MAHWQDEDAAHGSQGKPVIFSEVLFESGKTCQGDIKITLMGQTIQRVWPKSPIKSQASRFTPLFANSFTLIANTSDNVEEKEQRLCARYPVDGVAVIALINLIYNMNKNIQWF